MKLYWCLSRDVEKSLQGDLVGQGDVGCFVVPLGTFFRGGGCETKHH